MYPCGNCHAAAVGPDGRCAACGTYQQQLQQQPGGLAGYPAAPPIGMPAGGVDLRRGVRTALTVMFGFTLAGLVLVLIAAGNQYSVFGDFLDGKKTLSEAEDADDFAEVASVLYFLVVVPVIVLWAVWFRRLRLNAEVFAPGGHRFGPGWAAGAWFTPVVNLWFPKQIANDIWRASSPQGPQAVSRGLLNGWWVTFLAGMLVDVWGNVQYTVAENKLEDGDYSTLDEVNDLIDTMHGSVAIGMFATVLNIAAAILALLLIRQITTMQEQRAALGPQPGGPAPYGMPGGYGQMPGQPGAAPYGQPPAPGPQAGPYPPYGSGPTGY
ncbi:DUF4328 domain-containing protein [Streptomyces sp. NPDC018031]|uniref:DUF4328 domain-containing protein n=1 Tax=Streptomyces sp. NPDC018031 TaxID=3365033 RepID=UPI00379749AE